MKRRLRTELHPAAFRFAVASRFRNLLKMYIDGDFGYDFDWGSCVVSGQKLAVS